MSEIKSQNLMEGLLEEMNRVREIIKEYEQIPGGAGQLSAALMKLNIEDAEKAIGSGDIVKMLVVYGELKEYEL